MMRNDWIRVSVGLVMAACTRHDFSICESNSDCTDPSRPVCDMTGKCVAGPDAAPLCAAGMPISCTNDVLTTCGTDGNSMTTQTCALGCASAPLHCLAFQPSNGLGPALVDAATQNNVVLPSGTRIDTGTGLVLDASGNAIPVKTIAVAQIGGPTIFVVEAKTLSLGDTSITGANAIAFVAAGQITVSGQVRARGLGTTAAGPSAQRRSKRKSWQTHPTRASSRSRSSASTVR